MNNNYEWQTHQVKERYQARLNEAESYRQRQDRNGRLLPLSLKMAVPMLIGVMVIIWLLTACTPDVNAIDNTEVPDTTKTGMTMADRIRFQDERELFYKGSSGSNQPSSPSWEMADRIRFQDERELAYKELSEGNQSTASSWTMADRIRFQDRISQQKP